MRLQREVIMTLRLCILPGRENPPLHRYAEKVKARQGTQNVAMERRGKRGQKEQLV